jgi:hypothetical protein
MQLFEVLDRRPDTEPLQVNRKEISAREIMRVTHRVI